MARLYQVRTTLQRDKRRGPLALGHFLISIGLLLPWVVRYNALLNRTDYTAGTSLLFVSPFGVIMCVLSSVIGIVALFSDLATREVSAGALIVSFITLMTLIFSWLSIGPWEEDFSHFLTELAGQGHQWSWGIGIYLTTLGTIIAVVSGVFGVISKRDKQQITSVPQ